MKKICVIVGIIGGLLVMGGAGGGDVGALTATEVLIRCLIGFSLMGIGVIFYPRESEE